MLLNLDKPFLFQLTGLLICMQHLSQSQINMLTSRTPLISGDWPLQPLSYSCFKKVHVSNNFTKQWTQGNFKTCCLPTGRFKETLPPYSTLYQNDLKMYLRVSENKGWHFGLRHLQWLMGCSSGASPGPMTAWRTGLLVRNAGLQPPLHQLCRTSAYAVSHWKV